MNPEHVFLTEIRPEISTQKAGRGWAFHKILGRVTQKTIEVGEQIFLVGGFNPSENYARQNEFIFPIHFSEWK